MIQLEALGLAAAATLLFAAVLAVRSATGRAHARRSRHDAAPEPYILYFTGENCTLCRTHQEPALRRLPGVRVERVDAVADRDLSRRFSVYTIPTTVVISAAGEPLHVNYGYAPADRLRRQLASALPA